MREGDSLLVKGWVIRWGSEEGDSLLVKGWVIRWDSEGRGQSVGEGMGY